MYWLIDTNLRYKKWHVNGYIIEYIDYTSMDSLIDTSIDALMETLIGILKYILTDALLDTSIDVRDASNDMSMTTSLYILIIHQWIHR